MSEIKPQKCWTNYMQMNYSLEVAKEWTPKAEWSDLRCYVPESDYTNLEAENKRLRDALEKYGRHHDDCICFVGHENYMDQCDCGFDAVTKSIERK
jgi:hypothetical protein